MKLMDVMSPSLRDLKWMFVAFKIIVFVLTGTEQGIKININVFGARYSSRKE